MKLPIGVLIYWAHQFENDHAVISGIWYYKEMYVPSTIEEKKKSISDLKEKRCTVINIHGRYDQIQDILSQGDRFIAAGTHEISRFLNLIEEIKNSSKNTAYLFDNIYNIKGTALMVDTVVEVNETMEEIMAEIKKGKPIYVTLSQNWSYSADFIRSLST